MAMPSGPRTAVQRPAAGVAPGSGGGAPLGMAGASDPARVRAVQEFIVSLRKATRSIAMYFHDKARFPTFLQPAQETLAKLLSAGPLVLSVEVDAFVFQGERVWAVEGADNVPEHFFLSGVRMLRLNPGLDPGELTRLVLIMLSTPEQGSEDVLAQLFGAALPHVQYAAADLVAFGDLGEVEVAKEVHRVTEELKRRHAAGGPSLLTRAAAVSQAFVRKLPPPASPRARLDAEGCVGGELREELEARVAVEAREGLPSAVLGFALSQLDGGGLGGPEDVAQLALQVCKGGLAAGTLAPVGAMLQRLESPSVQRSAAAPALRATVGAWLAEEAQLDPLVELLDGADPELDTAARWLALCPASAASPLLERAARLRSERSRAFLVQAALALSEHPETAVASALTKGWEALGALAPVLLLGIPPQQRVRCLTQLVRAPNPAMQTALLALMPQLGDGETLYSIAFDCVGSARAEVAEAALRVVARLAPVHAARDLARLQRAPEWDKHAAERKQVHFEALGLTNADEALAVFTGALQAPKKGLFGGGARVELKRLAVHGLGFMTRPEAAALLQAVPTMPNQDSEAVEAARVAVLARRTKADRPGGRSGTIPAAGGASASVGLEAVHPTVTAALEALRRLRSSAGGGAGGGVRSSAPAPANRPSAPAPPARPSSPPGRPHS